MRAYGFRLPVVLASLAAVLAILFGAQFLYARQAWAVPLNAKLEGTSGVIGQPVVTTDALGLRVNVHLALVDDLQTTYHQLLQTATAGAGGRHVTLSIKDDRTAELTKDYVTLSMILDQGRATGQFVDMEKQFSDSSRQMGLTRAQVTVDNTQMYVELVSGQHYLYDIMPLTLSPAATAGGAA